MRCSGVRSGELKAILGAWYICTSAIPASVREHMLVSQRQQSAWSMSWKSEVHASDLPCPQCYILTNNFSV